MGVAFIVLALASSANQELECKRVFTQGAKENYTLTTTMVTSAGEIDLRMGLSQEVLKVNGDGSAEIENKISNFETFFNSGKVESEANKPTVINWKMLLGSQGLPAKGEYVPKGSGFLNQIIQLGMLSASMPAKPSAMGSEYAVKWSNKQDKSDFEGAARLVEAKDGMIRITGTFKVTVNNKTSNFKTTSWVDQKTYALVKSEGVSLDAQGPTGVGLKEVRYLIERTK